MFSKVDEINFCQLISIHAIIVHLNLDYDKEKLPFRWKMGHYALTSGIVSIL